MTATEVRLHEATFRAFGSNCRVVSDAEATVLAAVHRLEDLEGRWSRFRATSEVSNVNAGSGDWVEVSAVTALLFQRAEEAQRRTNGLFDPLMLRELIEIGYEQSHETLDLNHGTITSTTGRVREQRNRLEIAGPAVRIPENTGFDPGGIGKGLAADLLMEDLLVAGATWAMVSLGGDIRFGGGALANEPVGVQIDDPREPEAVWGKTWVKGGAIATSSTTARRWKHGHSVHHHLLDPATGLPTQTDRIAATVFAHSAWWADVVAKSLIIDPTIGIDQLVEWGAQALLFTNESTVALGLNAQQGE